MATFEVVKRTQIKFKILDLAVKENERIISRNKVNKLENNIIEEVTDTEINNSSNEFYMRHRVVNRKRTESTKLRVVYEASVKFEPEFSHNNCLETVDRFKINYGIV